MNNQRLEIKELLDYLTVETCDRETDILKWWKANEFNYPILAKMARDYLAVPGINNYRFNFFYFKLN